MHPLLLHLPIGFFVLAIVLLLVKNQFKRKAFQKTYQFVLVLTAISLVITALMGVALSREGGYDAEALSRHLNTGVMLSLLTAVLISLPIDKSLSKTFYVLISLSFILIILTGHYGATLTHGENYVWAPLMKNKEGKDTKDTITVFGRAIAPVLEKKCTSCHNPKKKKGELILTNEAYILKGGEHGIVLVAGNVMESELLKRIHLAPDDDDHMPPSGKPQLASNEIALLELWIAGGAEFNKPWSAYMETDSLKIVANQVLKTYQKPKPQQYDFDFASSEKVKKLNNPFRHVSQLSQDAPALQANFYLAQYYQSQSLKELSDVKSQLTYLNLAGMPVDDKDISFIVQFKNLETLNLNNTKVTDLALNELSNLPKLKKLSVAGAKVGIKALEKIGMMKSSKEVYCWNTLATPQEIETLKTRFPTVTWNTGFVPDENEKLKLTPPILKNENFLLGDEDRISLKHNLPGTVIRYTLDGTSPDSINGTQYNEPISINSHTILKTIATKDGWFKSSEQKYHFYKKGMKPSGAKLLSSTSKDYKAKGAASLIDDQIGDADNFRDGNWLGFRENPAVLQFTFDKPTSIKQLTLLYNKNIGSYLMPPQQVEVWGGETEGTLRLISTAKPIQPLKYESNTMDAINLTFDGQYSLIKVIAKPVAKLPTWHSGKGEKGWLMISEVIFK
jgi:uncharacterized membrane protein